MDLQFGKSVKKEADRLAQQGKDPNQIAGLLAKQDPMGHNYGIGIVLDGQGHPLDSSATLTRYASKEILESQIGTYLNSAASYDKVKEAVLKWQRIPEKYWDNFQIALPSDAGTGAVQAGVDLATLLNPKITTLTTETLGWMAYKAIATVAKLTFKEHKPDELVKSKTDLLVYQAGPMNTTGEVKGKNIIEERAEAALKNKTSVLLDRAYSGFEFTSLISKSSYNAIMEKSYDHQIAPFLEKGVPFSLALSPTKSFVTFALRPAGILLVYIPEPSKKEVVTKALNTLMRARGSAFEHPITRAFVKALIHDLEALEKEHHQALLRVAEAETLWRKLVKGTAIEYLFSDHYAGLFRNPPSETGADIHIYNEHIYPVFSKDRCRQNITGLPNSEALARTHVDVFSAHCN